MPNFVQSVKGFLPVSTPKTVTYSACKAIEFGEKKTQNKGYYAVQGHSRSVLIESPYATSY